MNERIESIVAMKLPAEESVRIFRHRLTANARKRLPRIAIVTGIHGDELEGQFVCYEVISRIKAHPECLSGTVDVYPALNPLGIDTLTRGIPGFDLDMNRTFPGDVNGAVTEQIAAKIIVDLTGSDLVVDIHASNLFLREIPQIRISESTEPALMPYAKLLNVDFVWIHAAATVLESTLAHSLNNIGTKTLVVEMGVGMRVTQEYAHQLTDGIFNAMKALGIWTGEVAPVRSPMISAAHEVEFLNAPCCGLFVPGVEHLHRMKAGEAVGSILDPLKGTEVVKILAPCDGLLFTLREYPIVDEGSLIARILRD